MVYAFIIARARPSSRLLLLFACYWLQHLEKATGSATNIDVDAWKTTISTTRQQPTQP
jgi:hypothetical protein